MLLMIAEYHRTDGKNEWPSTETLALDCLMEERSVRRIINRLIEGQFLERDLGGGRGRMSSYRIVGLDCEKRDIKTGIVETLIVETGIVTGTGESENRDPTAQKQGPASTRNKVLQDLPVKESYGGEQARPETPMQAILNIAAERMIQLLCLVPGEKLREAIKGAITAEAAFQGIELSEAAQFISASAMKARKCGAAIDKFYFEDTKWRNDAGQGSGNTQRGAGAAAAATRSKRSIASLQSAARRFAAEADSYH